MKIDLKSSNAVIVGALVIVGVGIAFWMLAVSPKRDEAAELDRKASSLETSLALHEGEVTLGEAARERFAADYQKLVVLGKAVPGDDDTASLVVQISRIAEKTDVDFRDIKLTANSGSEEAPPPAPAPGEAGAATEAAASLLPFGASVGPAGLAVMPYTLTFDGNFFTIADFIAQLDSLVETENADVLVDGRLITVDGFSLAPDPSKGFPALEVSFAVTTYLTPPGQGITGGAVPSSPETAIATPASATIEGTP
jgi:Tfp pilus assembly protein PilO